ncbi:hypothetical protein MKK69_29610 [Methylobacterium sp. J-026]|uniref:hypothetical protein n=1 Tax=Methylobacterium sp. J-026 TaxID=2836624 RepID=UPI001FBA0FEB|nr:hypothetical protein [Methylobacterium sp. J-026]MCJ2138158.1 hypothetical protein [Methylobacterium sp. J-026]
MEIRIGTAQPHYFGTQSHSLRLRVGCSLWASVPEGIMRLRTGGIATVVAAGLVIGIGARAEAAELGFLEMLFGARPAPQQVQPTPAPALESQSVRRDRPRLGAARRRLQTRYAALPLKIHVKESEVSPRQTRLDMKDGAASALLKDETLKPGDIVVLNSGARVFTGNPDTRHALRDFAPVQGSRYVSNGTRKVLSGLFTPIGPRPGQEARRMMARASVPVAPIATPIPAQKTAMRIINPWLSGQ